MPEQKDSAATAAVTTEVAAVNPLLAKKIRTTVNYHEWLALLNATDDADTIESCLHVGFKKSMEQGAYGEKKYDETDRIIFYFFLADGRTDNDSLRIPEDKDRACFFGYDQWRSPIWKVPSKIRQYLAEKAFNMLCLNFFKIEVEKIGRDDEFGDFWHKLIRDDRLLPVIQNYFRAEKHWLRGISLRNYDYRDEASHNEQQAVNFLLKLARFIFSWKEPYISPYDKDKKEQEEFFLTVKSRVDAAKPWLIEVLAQLGKLNALRKWMLELDQPCFDKLKEIALRTEVLEDGKTRLVLNLEEARFFDSESARFLEECELKKKVSQRLAAIRKAKWKKEKADNDLAEILKNQKE